MNLPELKALTDPFRTAIANVHAEKAKEARQTVGRPKVPAFEDFPPCLEVSRAERGKRSPDLDSSAACGFCRGCVVQRYRLVETRSRWHEDRRMGQIERFERLGACGTRKGNAGCDACGVVRVFSVGCEISRLCLRCSTRLAIERRAKFGLARAARIADARRHPGRLFGRYRKRWRIKRRGKEDLEGGGRWTEKLFTLTIPHFQEDTDPETVRLRIRAIFQAWKFFARLWSAHWRKVRKFANAAERPWLFRSFEWTPGSDGLGHPHFHCWVLSSYLDRELLASWWAQSLRKAGVDCVEARIDIRTFPTLGPNISRELIKAGKKRALEWSRFDMSGDGRFEGGAVDYADGWSIADVSEEISSEVGAGLYEALEGSRLSQGSAGFYVAQKPTCECADCGAVGEIRVWFEFVEDSIPLERGPPCLSVRNTFAAPATAAAS